MFDAKKHEIIMKHYHNPQNQTDVRLPGYIPFEKQTSYCGDKVIIQLKCDNNKIIDIKYEANVCSICVASASVMSVYLQHLTKTQTLNKINHFMAMVQNQTYDSTLLNSDLKSFDIVYQLPGKINCVLLPWQTLQEFLLG
ncbi:iron-sulfur cluster assembly scaffold protein ['Catharanthus roseus' aster yellows phytoplasma]|uniref:iron-sulfur cluster assembly scaffold protein n=1 Tax='Catharanthus roseus' aster yellows phytoplasma TaxID=1193712 RepID=UPI001F10ED65|nr:iron-sulfur cluster assembly scaffold protein ['Catharanthus roseus' aster yellows phytoplasma]